MWTWRAFARSRLLLTRFPQLDQARTTCTLGLHVWADVRALTRSARKGGIVKRRGGYRGARTEDLSRCDHDVRASLYGIEAVAAALNKQRERLLSDDLDQLVLAISSRARRLRVVLDQREAGTDELVERDHQLRAALFGIDAVSVTLNEQRDRLPWGDVDQVVLAIASEARRLRLMLVPRAKRRIDFDLAKSIRPAIVITRSIGVVVRDTVPAGMMVHGRLDDVAEVVFALLDNARVHAAPAAVDVRATSDHGTTTLYVEDRGPGITDVGRQSMFERGRPGARSSGSGLGLYIANRLMVEQGGSLTVDARDGGGASFALSLPTSHSGSSERLPRAAASRRSLDQRAVLVSDRHSNQIGSGIRQMWRWMSARSEQPESSSCNGRTFHGEGSQEEVSGPRQCALILVGSHTKLD